MIKSKAPRKEAGIMDTEDIMGIEVMENMACIQVANSHRRTCNLSS